jgi:hypothetical protein
MNRMQGGGSFTQGAYRNGVTLFSLDQWLRHLPVQMTEQHLRLSPTAIARIPDQSMNIIPR